MWHVNCGVWPVECVRRFVVLNVISGESVVESAIYVVCSWNCIMCNDLSV